SKARRHTAKLAYEWRWVETKSKMASISASLPLSLGRSKSNIASPPPHAFAIEVGVLDTPALHAGLRRPLSSTALARDSQLSSPRASHTSSLAFTRSMTASVNSVVVALPPRSAVRTPL